MNEQDKKEQELAQTEGHRHNQEMSQYAKIH